ncbi:hypothetical protein KQX54_011988 [Cotesia glomerata]|uniref:Uncharacterized protein n=1 Tax=Cotesia glomerata TaxID=32391 RepID=A0AAV7I8Q3_COTGL|nr:hypothetical protein KQX54_011988 [Cotesia glomerata]
MGKRGKRTGLNYQLRKIHAEYASGKVYHRPLIEWNYWEENSVPRFGHFVPIAAIEQIRKNQSSVINNATKDSHQNPREDVSKLDESFKNPLPTSAS